MSVKPNAAQEKSHAYDLFILVLTILSLVIMVLIFVPTDEAVTSLLIYYDNAICVVFLVDFFMRLRNSESKRQYFIYERGWLDLLGSIPSFGFFKYTALLRLARLSRLARVGRLLDADNRKALVRDVVRNRGQYAAFITVFSAFLVLVCSSILVLMAESHAPGANITTGGDALWWAIVTITTVGYGDKFPITTIGRMVGVFVMFAGVGIIGSLASILSSVLVPPQAADSDVDPGDPASATAPVAPGGSDPAPAARIATGGAPAGGVATITAPALFVVTTSAPKVPQAEDPASVRDGASLAVELAQIRAELTAIRLSISAAGGDEAAA